MKKFLAVAIALVFSANLSFASRGGENSFENTSSSQSNSTSCSKSTSQAGKFGIGYSKMEVTIPVAGAPNAAVGLDQIAARYWFNDNFGMDVALGFKAGDADTAFLLSAKVIGNIMGYKKLNIYWLAGLGFGSYKANKNADSATLFRVQGGVGAEFFVLPCLSVLTEMGLQYMSASANSNTDGMFGFYADWLPQAGVRFYFK